MGKPGSALDNTVIEARHSTLEFEPGSVRKFRDQARTAAAAWVEDYNSRRGHFICQMMSSVNYEQASHAGSPLK